MLAQKTAQNGSNRVLAGFMLLRGSEGLRSLARPSEGLCLLLRYFRRYVKQPEGFCELVRASAGSEDSEDSEEWC